MNRRKIHERKSVQAGRGNIQTTVVQTRCPIRVIHVEIAVRIRDNVDDVAIQLRAAQKNTRCFSEKSHSSIFDQQTARHNAYKEQRGKKDAARECEHFRTL